jgi:hypothetical protein
MALASPTKKLLSLGAGELLWNRFDEDGLPTGFIHMGNVDTFEITTADDRIIKRSSMQASRPVYAERNRQRTVTLRIVCDETAAEIAALHLMGSVVDYTQAATPIVDEVLVAAAAAGVSNGARLGGYYKTAKYSIDTVTMDAGVTPLVAGDDFVVHSQRTGLIHILEDAPNVTPGDALTISYTPAAVTAGQRKRIRGGMVNTIEGAILFVPDNSEGPNRAVQVWNASVSPDGAMGLISDEYSNFALTFTVQDDSAGLYGGTPDEALYAFTDVEHSA